MLLALAAQSFRHERLAALHHLAALASGYRAADIRTQQEHQERRGLSREVERRAKTRASGDADVSPAGDVK